MSIATPEVRKKAIEAYINKKGTQQQVADFFSIHVNTLKNWLKAYQEEKRLTPRMRGHMAQAFNQEEKEKLKKLILEKNDITLVEIRAALGKKCSLMAIHREVIRQGFRVKKNFKSGRTKKG